MILLKMTSRSRPHKCLQSLESAINLANIPELITLIVSMDSDDPSMEQFYHMPQVKAFLPKIFHTEFIYGFSESKIHAINRDIAQIEDMDWMILINLSDDQVFIKQGWDEIVRSHAYALKDFNGVVHLNDGYVQDKLMTMSIMTREYLKSRADKNGNHYIYHPDYKSVWCDNEETEIAKMQGTYVYVPEIIFRHEHPANTSSVVPDDLYKKNESFHLVDKKTYEDRKLLGFPR